MTKSAFVDLIASQARMTRVKAEIIVNTIFDSMVEALQRGERIEIRSFGTFSVRAYEAYEGRNPRTGALINVKAKKLPFFKVGKELRNQINANQVKK